MGSPNEILELPGSKTVNLRNVLAHDDSGLGVTQLSGFWGSAVVESVAPLPWLQKGKILVPVSSPKTWSWQFWLYSPVSLPGKMNHSDGSTFQFQFGSKAILINMINCSQNILACHWDF